MNGRKSISEQNIAKYSFKIIYFIKVCLWKICSWPTEEELSKKLQIKTKKIDKIKQRYKISTNFFFKD